MVNASLPANKNIDHKKLGRLSPATVGCPQQTPRPRWARHTFTVDDQPSSDISTTTSIIHSPDDVVSSSHIQQTHISNHGRVALWTESGDEIELRVQCGRGRLISTMSSLPRLSADNALELAAMMDPANRWHVGVRALSTSFGSELGDPNGTIWSTA